MLLAMAAALCAPLRSACTRASLCACSALTFDGDDPLRRELIVAHEVALSAAELLDDGAHLSNSMGRTKLS